MALHVGIGFSQFAHRETELRTVIALTPPPPPEPKHKPFVSKKKEAKRRRAELEALKATPLTQIEFEAPCQVVQARQEANYLASLEDEMRNFFGLSDDDTEVPSPEPVSTAAPLKPRAKAVKAAPVVEAKPAKPAKPRGYFKREFEVILEVINCDGMVIPFYHNDTEANSSVIAEINASKKARKFGLTILQTLRVETKEYDCRA